MGQKELQRTQGDWEAMQRFRQQMTEARGSQRCGQVDGSAEFGDNKNMLEGVVKD